MKFEAISAETTAWGYPQFKSVKDREYFTQYAKAAYCDFSFNYPRSMFYNNAGMYQIYRLYGQGNQPTLQYQRWMGIKEKDNDTWLNLDWKIRDIISVYKTRAIARLMRNEHGIVATPIDMNAKTSAEDWIAKMKVKIIMRDELKKMNPELANHPMFMPGPGEPRDLEELEMRLNFGEQFVRAMDAELAINLAFFQNSDKSFRKKLFEDLYDLGVCGYKEWLGDDGMPKFRYVDPECVITSFSKRADFKDIVHAGEIIYVSLSDLAVLVDEKGNRIFSNEDLIYLRDNIMGKHGNPVAMPNGTSGDINYFDKFKVAVFDMEFIDYEDTTYGMSVDKHGNLNYRKAENSRGAEAKDKYDKRRLKYVYKCKWIVGTDMSYEYGKKYDQKRKVDWKKKAETELSYRFRAINFYQMEASGVIKKCQERLDDYQMTKLRLQNLKARMIPSGWFIDIASLENVALKKGGKNMTPRELLEMFMQTGVLVGNNKNLAGDNINYKPILPLVNSLADDLVALYNELVNIMRELEIITGYNQITSGNPNPKTLKDGYEIADASTEDALFELAFAETELIEQLAQDVLCRMQQAVRRGHVEGYLPALNSNQLRFIEVSPDLSARDYGIKLEEKSSDEDKSLLLQAMQGDIANGFLDSADVAYILTVHNVKQAQMIFAHKVKKNKENIENAKLAHEQATFKGQQESAAMASQMKAQEIQLEWALKTQFMREENFYKFKMKEMEMSVKRDIGMDAGDAKVATQVISNQAKTANSA
jgi:hypothetical protein